MKLAKRVLLMNFKQDQTKTSSLMARFKERNPICSMQRQKPKLNPQKKWLETMVYINIIQLLINSYWLHWNSIFSWKKITLSMSMFLYWNSCTENSPA